MKFCWLGIHHFKIFQVDHYTDVSYSKKGSPSTLIILRCMWCPKLKEEIFFGSHVKLDPEIW